MRKFFLVDPARYERLMKNFNAQKSKNAGEDLFSHPNVKKTKELDKEIDDILTNQSMTDYEKNEHFNSKLNDYVTNFRTALSTSKREALLGKPTLSKTETFAPSNAASILLEDKLSSIPESYQQNARKLINFLKSNDAFSWNDKGELKYKDIPIQGSDVVQLLHDTVRTKKISSSNAAFDKFIDALKSEGYPIRKTLSSQKRIPSTNIVKRKKRVLTTKRNSGSRLHSPFAKKDILKSWVTTN